MAQLTLNGPNREVGSGAQHGANPVSASVCLSVSPLSALPALPDSSWERWAVWAGLGAASSSVVEAGLLVSIGDPSSCDTPTATGSAISGLREAERNNAPTMGVSGVTSKTVNVVSNKRRSEVGYQPGTHLFV